MKNDIKHTDGTITRGGKRFGCHCDISDASEIDGCVIDSDAHWGCIHANYAGGRKRKTQWTCRYWMPIP